MSGRSSSAMNDEMGDSEHSVEPPLGVHKLRSTKTFVQSSLVHHFVCEGSVGFFSAASAGSFLNLHEQSAIIGLPFAGGILHSYHKQRHVDKSLQSTPSSIGGTHSVMPPQQSSLN